MINNKKKYTLSLSQCYSNITFHWKYTLFKQVINGVAFSAKWADLAEYYKVPAGITYPVGTLVKFGNKYYNSSNTETLDTIEKRLSEV